MGLIFPHNELVVTENFQELNEPGQRLLHIGKCLIQLLGKGIDVLAAIDAFPNEAAVSIQCNLAEPRLMEKLLGNPAVKSGPLLFQRNDPCRILGKFRSVIMDRNILELICRLLLFHVRFLLHTRQKRALSRVNRGPAPIPGTGPLVIHE